MLVTGHLEPSSACTSAQNMKFEVRSIIGTVHRIYNIAYNVANIKELNTIDIDRIKLDIGYDVSDMSYPHIARN